jgi:hypothetical protein
VELNCREVNAEHPQPVTGQLPGGRYAGPAAQVHDSGSGPQQAGQFRALATGWATAHSFAT